MSSSEVSRMLQIATKVVPNMKDMKPDIPFKKDNDNEDRPVNRFANKKNKGPKENQSRLQQKMEVKKTFKKEKQEVSEANGESTVVEKTTEKTTEKSTEAVNKQQKNKKKNKKKLNGKRQESYNVKEFSSNWEKFLKKQKIDETKTKTVEKKFVKKVKKVQENVKLTPAGPIPGSHSGMTPYVALDCEMVLVEGNVQALARCSIVNYNGHALYDKIIKPQTKVTNYLTKVSGITPAKLRTAEPYEKCREEILNLLKGRIIVGHTLKGDFEVLKYQPDEKKVRDISHLKSLKENGKTVGLKKLTEVNLKYRIQTGEHDSVEDARAAMALYRLLEKGWEEDLKNESRGLAPKKLQKLQKPKSGKEVKELREFKEVDEVGEAVEIDDGEEEQTTDE